MGHLGSLEKGHPSRNQSSAAWKRVIRAENFCRELGRGSSEQKTFVGSLEEGHLSRKLLSGAWKRVIRAEINCRQLRNFVSE